MTRRAEMMIFDRMIQGDVLVAPDVDADGIAMGFKWRFQYKIEGQVRETGTHIRAGFSTKDDAEADMIRLGVEFVGVA